MPPHPGPGRPRHRDTQGRSQVKTNDNTDPTHTVRYTHIDARNTQHLSDVDTDVGGLLADTGHRRAASLPGRDPLHTASPHTFRPYSPQLEMRPPSSPPQPLPVGGTPVANFSFLRGSVSISWAYWIPPRLEETCTCH